MNVTDIITIAISVISSGGIVAWYNAHTNAKRGKAQTETEARAQYTSEFKTIIAVHRDQITDLRSDVESLKSEMVGWRSRYEDSEQYIDIIVAGVYEGRYPPFPTRTQEHA